MEGSAAPKFCQGAMAELHRAVRVVICDGGDGALECPSGVASWIMFCERRRQMRRYRLGCGIGLCRGGRMCFRSRRDVARDLVWRHLGLGEDAFRGAGEGLLRGGRWTFPHGLRWGFPRGLRWGFPRGLHWKPEEDQPERKGAHEGHGCENSGAAWRSRVARRGWTFGLNL